MRESSFSTRKSLDRIIGQVKQDKQILAVFLFGSAARKENSKSSDVDICLVLSAYDYSPKKLSQEKLRYVKQSDLDIQIFQQLPLYIRIRVIKEGRLLVCNDEDKLYDIVFRTIQEFEHFKHIYYDYLKEVAVVR
jgi:hypothetical protein